MRLVILPYNMGSQGAAFLAKELEVKRIYPNRNYKPTPDDIVINWGFRGIPEWDDKLTLYTLFNPYSNVRNASDKFRAFKSMEEYGVSIPEFTALPAKAKDWVEDGYLVIGRQVLNGHSGDGIVLISEWEDHHNVLPLFTKYEKKFDEFRVHVFRGDVIDVVKKKLSTGADKTDKNIFSVRSHKNGWIFARKDFELPNKVVEEALKAIEALGLDFGAVDVGWNRKKEKATVYEVNTAPGLSPTTARKYANAISMHTGHPYQYNGLFTDDYDLMDDIHI